MSKLTSLSGFPEYLPAQQRYFNYLKTTIQSTFESVGFTPMETPAVEKIETLLSKGGIDQEVYAVKRYQDKENRSDAELALRFDLTVPLARYVAQHYSELVFPFRRYQIAPVWRGERAQAGRYRQFYQCDIDIIGEDKLSLEHDVEVLMVLNQSLQALGIENFTIRLNHKDVLLGFLEHLGVENESLCLDVLRVIDKKNKITAEQLRKELELHLNVKQVNELLELIHLKGDNQELIHYLRCRSEGCARLNSGIDVLTQILDLAKTFGCEQNLSIELSLARGLAYYTGIIFETTLEDYPQLGSIASGGRYDNLAEKFSKKKLPGIGMSIGLSRLFAVLVETPSAQMAASPALALIALQERAHLPLYAALAQSLRQQGLNVELYLEDKKLAQQFKYADKKGIPYVITANQDEIQANLWVLRHLPTHQEHKVSSLELSQILSKKV